MSEIPIPPDNAGLLAMGRRLLKKAGLEYASGDAMMLLCASACCDRAAIITRLHELQTKSICETFHSYLKKRAKKEPIQYIIGEWEFMGLPFKVNRDVLIPRSDTECLVESILGELADHRKSAPGAALGADKPLILDLCTGSGCVAISLAYYVKNAFIIASDISARALTVAKTNAELNDTADRILFTQGDLYAPIKAAAAIINTRIDTMFTDLSYTSAAHSASASIPASISASNTDSDSISVSSEAPLFDVVSANPPYIASEEWDMLPEDVRAYEPKIALDGGPGGLDFYYRIAEGAVSRLKPGGLLAVEVGAGQAMRVEKIFLENGFSKIRTKCDLNGLARVVLANI